MIDDLDESLKTLIKREALNGADVEIVFDAPNKEWAARRNTPTLDVYLYDIREDLKWRAYGSVDVRDPSTGFVATRDAAPRHFKLSYLITAWTQRPEDEHRLLSAVLTCFVRYIAIPPDTLTGRLADFTVPVPVTIGMPPPDDRPVSDVWTALGGELKPSLDLVVTLPLEPAHLTQIAPPVLEEPRIALEGAGDGAEGPAGKDRRRARGGRSGGSGRRGAVMAPEEAAEEVVHGGTHRQQGRVVRMGNRVEEP
jgi:hypothetical protein